MGIAPKIRRDESSAPDVIPALVTLDFGDSLEIPEWLGKLIEDLDLEKGAGHKYLRKVPTGKFTKTGKPIYRYFYKITGGRGLGHDDEMVEGAAFKVPSAGKEGHFHIIGKGEDGKLKIRHDESGEEHEVDPAVLRAMLHRAHAAAIEQTRGNIARDLEDVEKHGSEKQKARVKTRAQSFQGVHGGLEPDVGGAQLRGRAGAARKRGEEEKAKREREEEDRKRAADRERGTGGVGTAGGGEGSTARGDEGKSRRGGSRRKAEGADSGAEGGTKKRARRGGAAEVTDDQIEAAKEIIETPQPLEREMVPTGTWIAPKSPAITLHDDLLPQRAPGATLPEEIKKFAKPSGPMVGLFDHQVEGAERILSAWERGDGIVLQDDAGLGKTNTALAALAAQEKRLGRPARMLIVVPTGGKANLKDQWIKSAKLYGIDVKNAREVKNRKGESSFEFDPVGEGPGVFITAYDELAHKVVVPHPEKAGKTINQYRLKDEFAKGRWDAVAFDEAHNMTNPESVRADMGHALQDVTDKALYMSATPYTNVKDMHYLRKLGLFANEEQFHDWAQMAGARVENGEVKNPSSPLPMAAIAATFHVDGLSLKRTTSMEGVTSAFGLMTPDDLPPEAAGAIKTANDVIAMAAEAVNPMILRALYIGWSRQYLETVKVPHAIELAKKEIAAGRQVAFFTSFKDADHAHLKAIPRMIQRKAERMMEQGGPAAMQAMGLTRLAGAIANEIDAMPKAQSAVQTLVEAFGGPDQVAEIHGNTSKKPEREQAAYQNGQKKVVVATMARGGTGISLHDTVGNAPRTQINLSLPWSGREFVQVAGRSHRLGSKSNTTMHWLVGDDPTEKHNAAIVAKRLQSMGSLTQGDPEATVDATALAAWEFGATNTASESDSVTDSIQALEDAAQAAEAEKPETLGPQTETAQATRDYFREFAEQRASGRDVLKERHEERKKKEEESRRRELRRVRAQLEAHAGVAVHFDPEFKTARIGGDSRGLDKIHRRALKKHSTRELHRGYVHELPADALHDVAEKSGATDQKVDLAAHQRAREALGEEHLDELAKRGIRAFRDSQDEDKAIIHGNTYAYQKPIEAHAERAPGEYSAFNYSKGGFVVPKSKLGDVVKGIKDHEMRRDEMRGGGEGGSGSTDPLRARRLTSREITTSPYFRGTAHELSGNTFAHKETIKKFGGRFHGATQTWHLDPEGHRKLTEHFARSIMVAVSEDVAELMPIPTWFGAGAMVAETLHKSRTGDPDPGLIVAIPGEGGGRRYYSRAPGVTDDVQIPAGAHLAFAGTGVDGLFEVLSAGGGAAVLRHTVTGRSDPVPARVLRGLMALGAAEIRG